MVLESFNDIQSSGSLLGLFLILGELLGAPDVLDSQGFLLVFELKLEAGTVDEGEMSTSLSSRDSVAPSMTALY